MTGKISAAGSVDLQQLFDRGAGAGADDGLLLEQFAARRDEAAFAALVARHGPMVWATARAVLRNEHDAEDAFQATFLMLARRANSVRSGATLPAWLHRVAYRSALAAHRAAQQRRDREADAGTQRAGAKLDRPAPEPDLAATVRAEVERLPAANRLPVVLCDLEGLTYHEAAARLGWTEPMVRNRLAQARQRLRGRLARRGLAPALPLAPARLVVPAALLRAATELALGHGTPSTTVRTITHALARGMLMPHHWKILLTTALLAVTTWGAVGRATAPPLAQEPPALPVASPPRQVPAPATPPRDPADRVVRGRVIDPTGQPVGGALVTLLDFQLPQTEDRPTATTGADGRFELIVGEPFRPAITSINPIRLLATAPGFGFGWTFEVDREIEIRLVAAGPPIEGQIRDEAGLPVVGAQVRIKTLYEPRPLKPNERPSVGLTPFIDEPTHEFLWSEAEPRMYLVPLALKATTDGDGRFTYPDLGAERLVFVEVAGPTIATTTFTVMTRTGAPLKLDYLRQPMWSLQGDVVYPSRFEATVGPTRIVAGVARDAETGQPLVGWEVRGFVQASRQLISQVSTSTDAEGKYRLVGLIPFTDLMLNFFPPAGQPYLDAHFNHQVNPGQEPVEFNLNTRRAAIVRGRITTKADGQPMRAELKLNPFLAAPALPGYPGYQPGDSAAVYNDATGHYQFVVPPGRQMLVIRSFADFNGTAPRLPGFDPTAPPGALTPSRSTVQVSGTAFEVELNIDPAVPVTTLDVEVDPERRVELTVLDPTGQPLGGTEVEGVGAQALSLAVPQESARVELTGFAPQATRRVTVRHYGRQLAASLVVDPSAGPKQSIQLRPWGSVRGRVVRVDGAPWVGTNLVTGTLFGTGAGPEPVAPLPLGGDGTNRTDREGRFEVVGLVPGLTYSASVTERGRVVVGGLFENLSVRAGEVKDFGDLKVRELGAKLSETKP